VPRIFMRLREKNAWIKNKERRQRFLVHPVSLSTSPGKLIYNTSGFWPRVRACALRAPIFLSSLPPQTGRCAPPTPSIAASLLLIGPPKIYKIYKVLTYEEYRAVSGVFQNIDPPTPLHPANMSLPRTKGGGVHHTRREVREWEVNILEDARHWIGLLQYNLSAIQSIELGLPTSMAFFFPLDHRGCEI